MFEIKIPVDLYFGPGSLAKLPEATKGLGTKALIVTGKSPRRNGLLQRVIELLDQNGVASVTFEKAAANPKSITVDEGVAFAQTEHVDFVVGIGGGSPIDTAKAIAMVAANGGKITDYQPGGGYADSNPKSLPVVAIATTAGTGTEIDRYLVITNSETSEKPGIGFPCNYPAVGIVDPELMLTIPKDVTADTGVDVLYHALEAYLSIGAHAFSDMIAKEAIELVVGNLEQALANGQDLEARTNMAWASTLAGLAIDQAGTVAIHGLGHPVSGRLNVPHGQTLAALSVAYLRNNYRANPEKFAVLAKLLGYPTCDLSTDQLAAKSPDALQAFLERVGRNITLTQLGVTVDLIKTLTKDAFATMSGAIQNNPRPLSREDVEQLYRDSL